MLDTPLFNKPNWLKPEINTLRYWLHLAVIAFIVLGILQFWKGGNMLNVMNVLVSIPLIAAGDLVAHTILKMD